jgi:transcriptional regulator with XRE-family HTH domain
VLASVKRRKRIPKQRKMFGDVIRRRRTALGLSQEKLAEGVGCHRNYMGRIERGEQNITLDMMVRVARALKRSIAQLMGDAGL